MPGDVTGYVVVAALAAVFAYLLWRRWARQDRGEVNSTDDVMMDVLRDG
jgi:hypothetical protein